MNEKQQSVPIWEKLNITVEEAAVYSGVGTHKIRELMCESDCDFVLRIGRRKTLIKRRNFEDYLMNHKAI